MKKAVSLLSLVFAAGFSFAQTQLIGVASVGATLDSNSSGSAEAFIQTATATGSVAVASVYLDKSNTAKKVYIGLYSNSGGHPKSLLGSGTVATPVAGSWNTVAISPAVPVVANTSYHIAILGTGGTVQFHDVAGGAHSESSGQSSLTALPATWTTGSSWPSGPLSAYGAGTGGGVGGGVQISISPSVATVNQGAAQQFTAIVTGTTNTAVNWAVTSGSGSISPLGVFTAPKLQESDVVLARSQADTTKAAAASVTIPAVGIQIAPSSASISPNSTQQFTASVSGTVNTAVKWSATGKGTVNQSGLFTAPATNESDTVTATAAALPNPSATASIAVQTVSSTACGNTLNWTSSVCQQLAVGALNTAVVNGVNVPNAWTVVSRHGEYAQSENECNVPGAVSVANGVLTIKTTAASATCGDFNPTTGARCSGIGSPCPGTFPYTSGDVQWNTFSFKYGVVVFRAQFPTYPSGTWPAVWMLGTNCQDSNKYMGDTGDDGCPGMGVSGYAEIDNAEFSGDSSQWGRFNVANPSWVVTSNYKTAPVDGNYHVFSTVWTSNGVTQYMDDQVEASAPNVSVNAKMFLIVQTQTGGISTPVNSQLPVYLNVDYVKVCNSNYTLSQCENAASTDSNVIFWDDFGGPAQ
jgi:hypothetical protein